MKKSLATVINGIKFWVEEKTKPLEKKQMLSDLIATDMLPAVHDKNGKILTDHNGKIILRY